MNKSTRKLLYTTEEFLQELAMARNSDTVTEDDAFLPGSEDFVTEGTNGDMV